VGALLGPLVAGGKQAGAAAEDIAEIAEKILQAERVGSGLKGDVAHRAASFLSKEQLQAGKTFTLRGGDGIERTLLQTEGGLNGKNGIYEYILDHSGKVSHQRFIENGVINGIPNQKVPMTP
jgi:filamentous hemagglutinin